MHDMLHLVADGTPMTVVRRSRPGRPSSKANGLRNSLHHRMKRLRLRTVWRRNHSRFPCIRVMADLRVQRYVAEEIDAELLTLFPYTCLKSAYQDALHVLGVPYRPTQRYRDGVRNSCK